MTQATSRQAAAVDENSGSRRILILATLLTSNLFGLASCSSGFYLSWAVTSAVMDLSKQVVIDESHPPRHSVAVIATTGDLSSPGRKPLVYWLVKEPSADLAGFRLKYPEYSLLPQSDQGHISDLPGETDVDYQVLRRESGRAVVKTHYHHYPMLFTMDVRATYEATDSDIRLISYRSGSDTANGVIVGPAIAVLLGALGVILKRIYGTPSAQDSEIAGRLARHTVAYCFMGVVLLSIIHSSELALPVWVLSGLALFGVVGPIWIAQELHRPKVIPTGQAVSSAEKPARAVRNRILLGTVGAVLVNACGLAIVMPGHITVVGGIRASCVALVCAAPAALVWAIVSVVRGAKFPASWRVYEGTLFVITALNVMSMVRIYGFLH